MPARKYLLVVLLAALGGAPIAALADGFVPSNGDESYVWQGPRYDRVDGHWKRVDESSETADRSALSGFAGSARHDDPPASGSDRNAFGNSDGDTRFDGGMTSN